MTTNPLETEVSRILRSDNTQELATQLKQFNSYQSRIEQELIAKSTQINTLQNYLKQEIANIQLIVQENNKLKGKLEERQQQCELNEQKNKTLQLQVEQLKKTNDQSKATVRMLSEKISKLQQQETRPYRRSIVRMDFATQTNLQTRQQSDLPSLRETNSALLSKIGELEEVVMKLKHQKNQLKQKVYLLQNNSSIFGGKEEEEPHDTSLHQKLASKTIFEMIIQGTLKQSKFKGQTVNDKKQGKGICEYQDQIVYQGHFHEGKRHGLGTLKLEGQIIYRGYWKNGLMEGKGMLKMFEGEIQSYEGQFLEGKLQGYGCMTLKSGKKVIACWRSGKIMGNCLQTIGVAKFYREAELIECY